MFALVYFKFLVSRCFVSKQDISRLIKFNLISNNYVCKITTLKNVVRTIRVIEKMEIKYWKVSPKTNTIYKKIKHRTTIVAGLKMKNKIYIEFREKKKKIKKETITIYFRM